MKKIVSAVYDTSPKARAAVTRVFQAGFSADRVSLILKEEARSLLSENGSSAAELTPEASAFVDAIAPVESGKLSGAGPVTEELGDAGAADGLDDTLKTFGLPDGQAWLFAERVRRGDVLLGVHVATAAEATRVQNLLKVA